MDGDNRLRFQLTATWIHDVKTAFVKRELQTSHVGSEADQGPEVRADARHPQPARRRRRAVGRRPARRPAAGAVGRRPASTSTAAKVQLHLPRARSCGPGTRPTCVDSDELDDPARRHPPRLRARTAGALDARHNTPVLAAVHARRGPFDPGPAGAFLGPKRKGFEYLGVGITWAAFNQRRDDTKPTWTLSFDAQLDVFKDMRFDPANPGANTAVGQGYHQFVWSTFVSKRFRWFDPYFGAWYNAAGAHQRQPVPEVRRDADQRQPAAAGRRHDRRRADRLGEPARRPARDHRGARVRRGALLRARTQRDLGAAGGLVDLHDEHAPPTAVRASISSTKQRRRARRARTPGITDIDSYATLGGDLGLNVQVGKYIRFRSLFGFRSDLPHFITADGAGVDADATGRPRRPDGPERGEPDLSRRRSIFPGAASASRGPRSGTCSSRAR